MVPIQRKPYIFIEYVTNPYSQYRAYNWHPKWFRWTEGARAACCLPDKLVWPWGTSSWPWRYPTDLSWCFRARVYMCRPTFSPRNATWPSAAGNPRLPRTAGTTRCPRWRAAVSLLKPNSYRSRYKSPACLVALSREVNLCESADVWAR